MSDPEGVEVHFIARLSAAGLTEKPVDVLIFATPDHQRMLPVWVAPQADLGGRPTDAEILTTMLGTDGQQDPWCGVIATNSRGQMTAGIKQGQRYIDVRPSTLESFWHAGLLYDTTIKASVSVRMLPVNPAFIAEVIELQRRVAMLGTDDYEDDTPSITQDNNGGHPISPESLVLHWNEGLGTKESADVVDEFADMWKAMGLSEDLGDWLG